MSLPDFISSYWQSDAHGELLVGGTSVESIARRHGTPLFVYDSAVLDRKYQALREALPRRFSISYSVKANPNPAFLKHFLRKGVGLEIASAGEFHQAVAAGCSPANILFAGPGKTEMELEMVLAQGIGEVHAESMTELERVSRISSTLNRRARVAIRVNPDEDGQGGAMRMGGKPAPFGIDEEQLEPMVRRIADDPVLQFTGIHLFAGTQILDYKLLISQYKKGLEIARRAAEMANTSIQTLDFGGGLGIPYFPGDVELNLKNLREGLDELMMSIEGDSCFAETNFLVEPGRFLAAECGVYVSRIVDVKISRGKKFLILDGGMNHHLAASGNLGQVIKRNFPIALVSKFNGSETETVDVVGPLCTPLDTVGRSVKLPPAEAGDLLAIFQSGAYGRSASPLAFLSHPTPPEVWVEDGHQRLVRRRGSVQDYLRDVEFSEALVAPAS